MSRMITSAILVQLLVIFQICLLPRADAQHTVSNSSPEIAGSSVVQSVKELLPVGTFRVNVIAPTASPEAAMLIETMMRAVSKDSAWLLEHAKKSKPGEPWKYDKRLGLTPAEYKRAFEDPTNVELKHAGFANLTVTCKDDTYYLDGGEMLPELRGIKIDFKNDVVVTPNGSTAKGAPFNKVLSRPLEVGRRWQEVKGFEAGKPLLQQPSSARYLILGKELPGKPLTFDDFLVWLNQPPESKIRAPHAVILFSNFATQARKTTEQNLLLTFSLPPEKPLAADDPLIAVSLCGFARMYAMQQEPVKAQAALNKSLTIMRKVNDAKALELFIEALARLGRGAEVEEFQKRLAKLTPPEPVKSVPDSKPDDDDYDL